MARPIDNRQTRGLPPYRILVDGLAHGSDPSKGTSGNPVRNRVAFDRQIFSTNEGLNYLGHAEGDILAATADLEVVDDDHTTGLTKLYLGVYELLADVDYVTGGGLNATATNIAAAISRLRGFTALAVGPVVTVTGPTGPDGGTIPFYAVYGGSVTNYTFTPADGYLTVGAPVIGPIEEVP